MVEWLRQRIRNCLESPLFDALVRIFFIFLCIATPINIIGVMAPSTSLIMERITMGCFAIMALIAIDVLVKMLKNIRKRYYCMPLTTLFYCILIIISGCYFIYAIFRVLGITV